MDILASAGMAADRGTVSVDVASPRVGARVCVRCGRPLTKRRVTKWCRESCRVAAWHERRLVRQGLPPGLDVVVSSEPLAVPAGSQGVAVLRLLLGRWEQTLDALTVPRRPDCEEALRHARSAPRAAVEMLERVLRQAR